jgi:cysteine desulfurase
MAKGRIYLDYNATTPVDPRVIDTMLPYFYKKPGNAASKNHIYGWEADEAVSQARQHLADLIEVDAKEIIFTSGATEANNLALKGVFERYQVKGNHYITLTTEHKAVLDPCQRIQKMGGDVTFVGVRGNGLIDLEALAAAIREDTVMISVMWANNETGVVQPMNEIGELCAKHEILFFSDATQAVGKIPVLPKKTGIHLMSFSAHKMYGPKGTGALFVSRKNPRISLTPQMEGGGHELGMRSGTLNVPGIVGFGKAAQLARKEMFEEADKLGKLRDKLENGLSRKLEEVYINGSRQQRLAHVSNLSFRYVEGERLMSSNQDIAVSSGSACTSVSPDPSHVLLAMGLKENMVHSALRFSLGRFTTEEDIDFTIQAIIKSVHQLRSISPVWEMFKDGVDLDSI